MKRLVLTMASVLALGLAPAAALAGQTTGTSAGPGVRATVSPTNTATDQTNMGTYPTGPGHPANCGPGTNGQSSSASGATNGARAGNACEGYGSSTPPGSSGSSGQR